MDPPSLNRHRAENGGAQVLDAVITGGIQLLVVFTPLAIGSVVPWAYSLMEVVIFVLVLVWIGKLVLTVRDAPRILTTDLRTLFISLTSFIALIGFQLIPLPPELLRAISPATYTLYMRTQPGWPQSDPYKNSLVAAGRNGGGGPAIIRNSREAQRDVRVPAGSPGAADVSRDGSEEARRGSITRSDMWRPISIAPSLTATIGLKIAAYGCFFWLVLLYPFGGDQAGHADKRFFRGILFAVLLSGLIVAAIGIVEQATWNGRIMWFFIPADWVQPYPGVMLRASGPFVNPDHFANYLALIFPLAFASLLFRSLLAPSGYQLPLRLFTGLVLFIILAAMLSSASRAGWISIVLGLSIVIWIGMSLPKEARPGLLQGSRTSGIRVVLCGFAVAVFFALLFVGQGGRTQTDVRLAQSVNQEATLEGRETVWKDTVAMFRDFPLFGVGIGCWPEIFPHYRRPPWSSTFYRETHNDYLQLLAEAGLVGFGLLACFFVGCGRRLYCSIEKLSPGTLPVFAALLSGLVVMAFHSIFDFTLHIPANALLFTLFLAIALRMAGVGRVTATYALSGHRLWRNAAAGAAAVAVIFLAFAAGNQEKVPYPYNVKVPRTTAAARTLILSHPASSLGHLALVKVMGPLLSPAEMAKEFDIALWLQPTNPFVRDVYGQVLAHQGKPARALAEITTSVSSSPSAWTHFYLQPSLVPRLSPSEQEAIAEGFKVAIYNKNAGATDGLGAFYDALGRYSLAAETFLAAARSERDEGLRADYLTAAGEAYAQAGETGKAEMAFRQAVQLNPTDVKPYEHLIEQVLVPRKDHQAAKTLIASAVKRGADPFALYVALAKAEQGAGDLADAESAFRKALEVRPSDFEAELWLGALYLQENKFDLATIPLRKATEIDPTSAHAYYILGLAYEFGYQYSAADEAYSHALTLAPHNTDYSKAYHEFRLKVEQNSRASEAPR